jgi:hypothetical protein
MPNLKRSISIQLAVLPALALVLGPAEAAVIYDDGGVHTLAGPIVGDIVIVENGTTLDVAAGGSVVGPPNPPRLNHPPAVSGRDDGTLIRVSGGTIQGSDSTSPGGLAGGGLSVVGGALLAISGGTITGGTGAQAGGYGVTSSVPTMISGGTLTGGSSPLAPDVALLFIASPGAILAISGGTFQGGAGPVPGDALSFHGSSDAPPSLVTGGHFLGGVTVDLLFGGELDFLGSGLMFTGGSSGGRLNGILSDGSAIDVTVNLSAAAAVGSGSAVRFLPAAAVPEPSSLGMGSAVALAGLVYRWYRRKSSAA